MAALINKMKYSKKINKETRKKIWAYYDSICVKSVYSFERFCKDHLSR